MTIFEIMLIGAALAMDAFALTIANCSTYKTTLTTKKEWSMPTAFALFQFAMPVLGFYIGSLFAKYLQSFASYLTAGIFFILSAKIVLDNIKGMRETEEILPKKSDFTVLVLIIQAVATSIDAFAVGVTFAVELTFSVYIAAGIIGGITFIIVAIALLFGKYLGKLFGKYAEWAGAVILFALAVKNLVSAIFG